ncbi:MAG: nucleoside monophosphate kinase [Kofleriaceae bacterium]
MRLQIYFAAAVRDRQSFADLAQRIAWLETIGDVLTKHMASPATADLGRTDAELHAHDQALLARADVVIADLAAPSTGTGYMVARAVAAKLPVLCLYPRGHRVSAMIAGCPDITTRFYDGEAGFAREVRAFVVARAPRIFLAGPPGSGKGTLGKRLADVTGAAHVSTGELLRELVGTAHPHAAEIARRMAAGELVPAEIMRAIVVDRLRETSGFILDGYPPSRDDLANLTAAGITPDVVFYLDCGDATSVARQVTRATRSTDTTVKARDRVAVFHAAEASYAALSRIWYPDAIVVRVDAERSAPEVEAFVLECLRNLFGDPRRERSYFPLPAYRDETRSTRVHLHVDAADLEAVRALALAIYARDDRAQGQLKLYPIDALCLGPQIPALPVYRRMPNFHPITRSDSEAFLTGRLGDGDMAMMAHVLDATRARGGMAELEEYIGEWELAQDGTVTGHELPPLGLDLAALAAYADLACSPLPALELHHGFDLPKTDPPLVLADLVAACTDAGLVNGGWFVFANPTHWAYRSNEFSSEPIATATARLHEQARVLQALLAARGIAAPIGYSLELVHGIWVV